MIGLCVKLVGNFNRQYTLLYIRPQMDCHVQAIRKLLGNFILIRYYGLSCCCNMDCASVG
jgi:hypothetical protein